ncbi:MAG: UDP-4-amino-4,6-dideoxy-N-acetyl-beta-L-altrosamine transaminase, partial [Fuerstiella sp.]|nr:UDP-4-amino-4,6-dideoxy-N-acetyl-beta-L-altrosamine transaminase [Fuerstiella sp.]
MTDIQAALGLQQLRRFESIQQRRRDIVMQYDAAFKTDPAFQTPVTRSHVTHAWHLYVLRLNEAQLTIDRNQFIEQLNERNIGTSVHFIPIHLHSHYAKKYSWQAEDFPVALENYNRMLSLPLSPKMTDQDVTDVIQAVTDVATNARRQQLAA